MSDNVSIKDANNVTVPISTENVTTLNGATVSARQVQRVALAILPTSTDGTAVDMPGDAAFGADVDITRLPGTVAADLVAIRNAVEGVMSIDDNGDSLTVDGTVAITGSVTVTGALTDTQLRATAVPVSGPLTDTQLRATAVPVSGILAVTGPLTDTQLRATAVPVSGPLTDAQLRATAVPVSGTVAVTGALTDTQLRATAVPVTVDASAPALKGVAITPANSDLAANTRALWVGGAGDLSLIFAGDSAAVTVAAVAAGSLLPFSVKQVRTATTATLIVGLM